MVSAAVVGPVHRNDQPAATGLKPLAQDYTRHIAPLVNDGRLTDRGRALLADVEGSP